jgi:hypothetical protein
MYGVLVWKLLARTDGARRHEDYKAVLAGRPVLDTLRGAFDAMAELL